MNSERSVGELDPSELHLHARQDPEQTGDIFVLEYSWEAMCSFVDHINAGTDFTDPKAKVFKFGYIAIGLADHNNKDTALSNSFL